MLSDRCPVCLPVSPACDVGVLSPNAPMINILVTYGALQVFILYCIILYCQTVGRIKMKLGMQVGLGAGHTVLNGDPAHPNKEHSPQFSAHVHCGHRAGWIKMPLGMEVGLVPGDIMLDGHPAPPKKGTSPHPIFGPCLLWPNGWMDEDAT